VRFANVDVDQTDRLVQTDALSSLGQDKRMSWEMGKSQRSDPCVARFDELKEASSMEKFVVTMGGEDSYVCFRRKS
jgi:hypothetical protein